MYVFNKIKSNYKMTFVLRQLYFLLFVSSLDIFSSEVLGLYVLGIVFQQVSFICVQFPYEKIQKANLPFAVRNIKANAKYLKYIRSPAKYKKNMMDLCLYSEFISLTGLLLQWQGGFQFEVMYFFLVVSLLALIGHSIFVYYRVFRNVNSGVYLDTLYEQVVKKRPSVVVHFSGNSSSTYQLNTWLSVLETLDRQVLIVVREKHHSEHIQKTKLPIIFASKLKDLEFFIPASVKVALYVANVGPNLHLLRNFRMKHVFLGHGDSDKVSSMNNFTRVYDRIYVAGQAAIERYRAAGVDVSDRAFEIIGRPQLSEIQTIKGEPSIITNILYAPTWEGYFKDSDYSSLYSMADNLIDFVINHPREYSLTVKPHPLTGLVDVLVKKQLVYLKTKAQLHDCIEWIDSTQSGKTLFDCFNDSGLMITDVSSVMSDYLQSEKPLILTNPRSLSECEINEMFPVSKGAYILNRGDGEVLSLLALIKQEDCLLDHRQAMKSYILGGIESPLEQFNSSINDLYKESIDDAGEFEIKESKEKLKEEMLLTLTNNGGYSRDGNLWIRSDYGYADKNYFSIGDVVSINKTENDLSTGLYSVVNALYDDNELDFRLKIRKFSSASKYSGYMPSNKVDFSVYDHNGEKKLGRGSLNIELYNTLLRGDEILNTKKLLAMNTNTGGSSIGALWVHNSTGYLFPDYFIDATRVKIHTIKRFGDFKGLMTSDSIFEGEYSIKSAEYSSINGGYQIVLNIPGCKQDNLQIVKNNISFSVFEGEKCIFGNQND